MIEKVGWRWGGHFLGSFFRSFGKCAKRPSFCPKSVCFLFFKSKSTNLFQGLDSYDCNFHFVASSRFPGHFEKAWNTTRFCPFFSMNSNGAQGFNFNPCKKWRVVRKATSWWAKTSDILEKNPETCNLASIFYYVSCWSPPRLDANSSMKLYFVLYWADT